MRDVIVIYVILNNLACIYVNSISDIHIRMPLVETQRVRIY